jgi:hypothetical protein
VRRHAKAPSAGSTSSRGGSLGSIRRGSDAGRASSSSGRGSGAPSFRRAGVVFAAVLSLALAMLALAAPAFATKEVTTFFGNASGTGTIGGQFSTPRGVAVNSSGAGPANPGDIYVADDANNRIQRFDSNGNFVSAWGMDVTAPTANEQQKVTVSASSGTYKLIFNGATSGPIAYNASASVVQTMLAALSTVNGGANVAVSGNEGGPYTVTFQGTLAGANQPQMTADTTFLAGTATVTTVVDGTNSTGGSSTGFEVCTVAAYCKEGTASPGNGTTGGDGSLDDPQAVAVDPDTGFVYVSDRDNRRIDEYAGDGTFLRSFGFNVVASGPDNGAELQKVAVAASSGTYTLTFDDTGSNPQTTGPIAYNASAGAVQTALQALSNVGGGNILVSGPNGGPYTVRFVGALGNVNQPLLTHDDTNLGGTVTVTEAVAGGQAAGYEICDVADNPTDVCQIGIAGSGIGQIGSISTGGVMGIAVSPADGNANTGTLFFADSQNRRVNTYYLDGTNPSSFGSSAVFGASQPTKVAVDSRGIVYASNSNGNAEVERYDSQNANGGGVGFLAPILGAPPGINETQKLVFAGSWGNNTDTFTLTCPNGATTGPIVYRTGGNGRLNIQNALDATCGAGNTSTVGNPPSTTITFQNNLGQQNVPTTICTTLSGSGTCSITQEVNGSAPGGGALKAGTATATAGLAVDPDSDGAGPDQDVLDVLRDPVTGNTVVQQFGPTNAPGLTVAPTVDDSDNGAAAGFSTVNDLGLNDSSGRLYVSTSNSFLAGLGSGDRVYVLQDPATLSAPSLTVSPIATKTDTTATFSGTVDPQGALVSCNFEYSTDQVTWTDVPAPGCISLSPGGGAQAISQSVTGLIPNTHYYVRLQATRPLVPNSATVSPGLQVFDTDAPAPVVSNVGVVDVQDTSARMVGTIDPKHSATGYVFQYGTTAALGSSTPAVNIGSGSVPQIVTQVVGGLSPDTTYYYRLVATNLTGPTASASGTFHTRATPLPLPDDRGYEMVTPPDKNNGDIDHPTVLSAPKVAVSTDGNAVGFCGQPIFGENPSQLAGDCVGYVSRRGPDGWRTASPYPRYCRWDPTSGGFGSPLFWLSPNLDHAVVSKFEPAGCSLDPSAPVTLSPDSNLYREDLNADPADPLSYQLLNPQLTADPTEHFTNQLGGFVGGSDDFGHTVFVSYENQTDPPDSPAPGNFTKLYDWHDGNLSLVSKDTNNVPFATLSGPAYILGPANTAFVPQNAISRDGDRIFFQNPEVPVPQESALNQCAIASCQLYMRENATTTYEVSASECTVNCGTAASAAQFLGATSNGDVAFFQSCAKLTDASSAGSTCNDPRSDVPLDSNVKLYRWDENAAPDHRLVDLTIDREPADGATATVKSVVGVSDDQNAPPDSNAASGNTVYFFAHGQLVAGAPVDTTPQTEPFELYRWTWNDGSPNLQYLATFPQIQNQSDFTANGLSLHDRVTPDGRYLVVSTYLPLDPVADQDSDRDVYRWSEQDGWLCISCQVPGVPSNGNAGIGDFPGPQDSAPGASLNNIPTLKDKAPAITISDDGQRIFFDTPDKLAPQDTDGDAGCAAPTYPIYIKGCSDVYEWHDGRVSLITPGTGPNPYYLLGFDASGNDVFFFTRNRLVGWDVDNNVDIYDARVGGGFPEPAAAGAPCEGDACRSAGTSPPSTSGAGTASFQGSGNPAPVHKAKEAHHGKRKHHKHHHRRARRRAANHNGRAAR